MAVNQLVGGSIPSAVVLANSKCRTLSGDSDLTWRSVIMIGWQPIAEYSREKYDWVLVKCFDGDFPCVPETAEMRSDGKWYGMSERCGGLLPFRPKYFFDMQQLDNFVDMNNEPQ